MKLRIAKKIHKRWYGMSDENPHLIARAIRRLVKRIKSCPHNRLAVNSHAGPDSGYERHDCLDCGYVWSHVYY